MVQARHNPFIAGAVEVASKMSSCIFCRIVNDDEPSHKLWADAHFLAFLSPHLINPGHTLLITKQHVDYIIELREPLYTAIFQAARHLARPLRAATRAKRIGIAIEGLDARHLHIHLVPINNVGELDARRRTSMTAEEFFEMAEEIRKRIHKRSK